MWFPGARLLWLKYTFDVAILLHLARFLGASRVLILRSCGEQSLLAFLCQVLLCNIASVHINAKFLHPTCAAVQSQT